MKALLILLSCVLLLACEAESDPNRAAAANCPEVGNLTVSGSSGLGTSGRCVISGTLTVSATLPASDEWYIDGSLIVGDATSNPVLTIEAGTEIFGSADGASFDYLYLAPGASISAVGTSNDPIIFSSDDSNYSGSGEWGGIILEDTLAASGQIILEYVIVAEAGGLVTIGSQTYTDNIVFEGTHNNTQVQFLQSHDSAGDGIRLQSSESNVSEARLGWLLITGASRDGFSYQNFSGLVKDMLVIHRQGEYNGVVGGRAGIYASGANSLPLFVNVTLAGRDITSISSGLLDDREFGIVFADNTTQVRMANMVVSNFRNGCYEVDSSSDLSSIGLGSDITAGFIDGVHCGHEQSGLNGNVFVRWLLRSGDVADNLPDIIGRGDGNGDGFRFYGNSAFTFFGETDTTGSLTAQWYLESIFSGSAIRNGLAGNPVNPLNAFADGDTDGIGGIADSDDINAAPLRNGGAFFFGVKGSTDPSGFDLTHIGAIRSSNTTFASEFDGWTLQAGAVFPNQVTGFSP